MKRILLALIFLIISIHPSIYAEEGMLPLPTTSLTPSPEPTVVNYELPYPGILPGSPLYFLKNLRDKLQEALISDHVKKSNYYLLQADKRLSASILLYRQGNKELGEETLSKGLVYLDKSFDKMIDAEKSGENVIEIYSKLQNSSNKQKEQISLLLKSAKGDNKIKLTQDLKKAQEIINRVDAFKP